MNVLAIDTATDAAAVALLRGEAIRSRRLEWRATFTGTAPAIEALMEESGTRWADLDALVVPAGPGSFTGLRVGAAMALGIAEARGIELHAVPTLEAVAESFAGPGDAAVCVSLDARRGRRWVAIYERRAAGWRRLEGPLDVVPEDVAEVAGGRPVVGPDLPRRGAAGGDPPVAVEAMARLVARDPVRHRLEGPDRLRLVYARPGVDRPPQDGG